MSREQRFYIEDILTSAEYILEFVHGMNYESFLVDEKTKSAVVRKFEIIGEAAKSVPNSLKENYSSIPRRAIAGMRDQLIHGYFGVDYQIVWNTIEADIPDIISSMRKILKELPGPI